MNFRCKKELNEQREGRKEGRKGKMERHAKQYQPLLQQRDEDEKWKTQKRQCGEKCTAKINNFLKHKKCLHVGGLFMLPSSVF